MDLRSAHINVSPPHSFILANQCILEEDLASMSLLDVEQQLQQRQRLERDAHGAAFDTTVSFVHWDSYHRVRAPAALAIGVTGMTALVILGSMCSPRLRQRFQEGLRASRAGVLSVSFTALNASLLIAAWDILVGSCTVFSLMRNAVHRNVVSQPLPEVLLSAPMVFFLLKYSSLLGTWLRLMLSGRQLWLGFGITLLSFFPCLYESLLVRGDEPDRTVVWATHFSFLISLFMSAATAAPWLVQEYQTLAHDLTTHTHNALIKERPEMKKLRHHQALKRQKVR